MFESLYRYSRVLARHVDGPAAEERDRYVEHCAAGDAARESVLHLASELLVVVDINGARTISTEEIATPRTVGCDISVGVGASAPRALAARGLRA
jgi:integrase/recombinase XerD